jgi:predicted membrane protein
MDASVNAAVQEALCTTVINFFCSFKVTVVLFIVVGRGTLWLHTAVTVYSSVTAATTATIAVFAVSITANFGSTDLHW